MSATRLGVTEKLRLSKALNKPLMLHPDTSGELLEALQSVREARIRRGAAEDAILMAEVERKLRRERRTLVLSVLAAFLAGACLVLLAG